MQSIILIKLKMHSIFLELVDDARSRNPRIAQVFGKNLTEYLESSDSVLIGKNTPVLLATAQRNRPFEIKYTRVLNVSLFRYNIT